MLGVQPDEKTMTHAGISIPWLVSQFADCHRLRDTDEDYQQQLLFHTRAHLLLILGSLFPNSTGNALSGHLLYFVVDIGRVRDYSWGAACLSWLYRNLSLASLGAKKELIGYTTLLQVQVVSHLRSYIINVFNFMVTLLNLTSHLILWLPCSI